MRLRGLGNIRDASIWINYGNGSLPPASRMGVMRAPKIPR
jgi:hypothetical protein